MTDENVPDRVGRFFRERGGYDVQLVREVLTPGWTDRQVVEGCEALKATIVTWNKRDFAKIISRRPQGGNHQMYRHVGAIYFDCPEPGAVERLNHLIDLIDFEFNSARSRSDKRVFLTVLEKSIVIDR